MGDSWIVVSDDMSVIMGPVSLFEDKSDFENFVKSELLAYDFKGSFELGEVTLKECVYSTIQVPAEKIVPIEQGEEVMIEQYFSIDVFWE